MGTLIAEKLGCHRGGRAVFDGVGFRLAPGQLMQLTGPNGSGKSSLLRLIAGLGEPAAGAIAFDGEPADLTIGQRCHLIAHLDAIKLALTVQENLRFWRDFLGGGDLEAALTAFGLERLSHYQAALLSAGQRRRLSLSRLALVARPLWLLDEPTVGLDQASLARLDGLLRLHLARGGLAIAATHVELGIAPDVRLELGAAP